MEELRVLSPTAVLGYGYSETAFEAGMQLKPHMIGVDAGSLGQGPYYLGSGESFVSKSSVKRDLALMLTRALKAQIPLVIGSAGGSGADAHLDSFVEIINEIAREQGLRFKIALINGEIPKKLLTQKLWEKKVHRLFPSEAITESDIEACTVIVAQMGPEPFIEALNADVDVIVAGRAFDAAIFSCMAIQKGYDAALATHMGHILECAALAAEPGSGSDCMMGFLGDGYFKVMPTAQTRACTVQSIAAHTLYENADPFNLPGPGGTLDLSQATYEQVDERTVMVRGSRFALSVDGYWVKLEGVKKTGYRTVCIAACNDPNMIEHIEHIVEQVKDETISHFHNNGVVKFFLDFKIYGKHTVLSMFKTMETNCRTQEVGIIIEAVSANQEQSNTICGFARAKMSHLAFKGRKTTSGNLAFPFSPPDTPAGVVYEFKLNHLMSLNDPCECFNVRIRSCDKGEIK